MQPLLSEYMDNSLSARSTWEVDRHLSECHYCTRTLNELRRTASLLSEAPRAQVSDYFVLNLQAKLAGVEPAPPRNAWIAGVRQLLRPRALPAWGAAVATCALAVVLI